MVYLIRIDQNITSSWWRAWSSVNDLSKIDYFVSNYECSQSKVLHTISIKQAESTKELPLSCFLEYFLLSFLEENYICTTRYDILSMISE